VAPGQQQPERRRRRLHAAGLSSPLLPAPAVLLVLVGFVLPLGVLVVYSLWPTQDGEVVHQWTLDNWRRLFTQGEYLSSLLKTVAFISLASAITVVLTFPFAYFVATKVRPSRRLVWLLLAIIPFWTSYLIRVFAWLNLFGDAGLINDALLRIGLVGEPLGIFANGRPAIIMTFVYLLFPLAFLSAYIAIERMNPLLLEAASDLGARRWRALTHITLPIARSGILGGFILSFIAMMGDYVTPQLIGGTEGTFFSNLVINQFGSSVQWGFGTTLALVLLATVFLLLIAVRTAFGAVSAAGEYTRGFTHQRAPWLFAYALGYLGFLYVPMFLLVLFAVNDSERSGLPFEGFTLRWFGSVFDNPLLVESLWISLRVAAVAVGVSVVLGTLAAVQLSRTTGRLRAANLAVISMPLFLPPVVLGLAIIIGLNALDIQRGLWTITLAHIILTLPVVTLLVLVRLEGLDRNQELAALDLGARPWKAFLRISVPQALPGILAGALIAFALSMDEFILTFLVTGSDSTLPLYIYGSLRFRLSPELNAVSALILGASFLLVLAAALISIKTDRRSTKELQA